MSTKAVAVAFLIFSNCPYSYTFNRVQSFVLQPSYSLRKIKCSAQRTRNVNGPSSPESSPKTLASEPKVRLIGTESNKQVDSKDDNLLYDDAYLLETVPIAQFVELCLKLNLEADGTKEDLLLRLRQHADEQALLDQQRKLARAKRVQQGTYGESSKERYELVEDQQGFGAESSKLSLSLSSNLDMDLDDQGFFYFPLPITNNINDTIHNFSINATTPITKPTKKNMRQQIITAPPPPITPNQKGERVVTVYSTTEKNDLTASTPPGYASQDLMEAEGSESSTSWSLGGSAAAGGESSANQRPTLPVELEIARETILELVQSLLLLSGAPSFVNEFTDELEVQPLELTRLPSTNAVVPNREFIGFDPSMVPTDMLMASSKSLRAGRGSVLQDVLHELELRAVGYDGIAGDDKSKGGGHYLQVNKIRAFLEGFRRAELRRIARETTTLLLDTLASDGIQGLDTMLSSMTKSQDDSGDAGQLNDALVDFLNDMVREQESRLENLGRVDRDMAVDIDEHEHEDNLSSLWNVTSEDGQRIETLDPNNPRLKEVMVTEWSSDSSSSYERLEHQSPLPSTAREQLLLLLKLLRDRILAEAAFGNDMDFRGRNLRILAYCLRLNCEYDREKLIRREFQSSVDRLDKFLELVESSFHYAECVSTQLKPASSRSSTGMLNLKVLKTILATGQRIRNEVATE